MINENKPGIKDSIMRVLEKNKLMSLSTSLNDCPFICNVFYTYDENFNLYYWSEQNARHSLNVTKNNKIAVSIADSNQKFGSNLKGLKIYGSVSMVKGKDLFTGGRLYLKRFSNVKKWISKIADFNSKFKSRMYKIKPKKIILLDESKFGKEEYREIIL